MAARFPAQTLTLAAVLLLAHACADRAGELPGVAAVPIALAQVPAAEVPSRVLAHCHQGLVGMDRFAARIELPDGTILQAYAHLPDRLRLQWPDGAVHLLDGALAHRWTGAGERVELAADAAARLVAVRTLLDVAALGPLHRAIGSTRLDERTFAVAQPASEPWQLTLAAGSLLVERLVGPHGAVDVLEHLRTSTTQIVRVAAIEPLGRCRVRFDSIDCTWDESLFEAQREAAAPTAAPAPAPATITVGAMPRPTAPTLESLRAARWLVVDDPLDWTARAATVQHHMQILRERGQTTAGFAGLLQDGERQRLVIPFRAAPDAAPFAAPADWTILEVGAGRALAVYPDRGDLAQRRAEGEHALRQALQAQGLEAIGPIVAQPYLHLEEGAPAAAATAAPVVRVAVAVR